MQNSVKGERNKKINKKINKAFTLMEMLIVLVIFGILSTVMFRTYNKISEISFRTQREKNLTQELIYLSQVLQNLSDDYTIDYEKYNNQNDRGNKIGLIKNNGITSILYLTGKNLNTKYETIMLSSKCSTKLKSLTKEYNSGKGGCRVEMQAKSRGENKNNEETVALTNTRKVLFTPVQFKIIPYNTPENFYKRKTDIGKANCEILGNSEKKDGVARCIASNGFWILTTAYISYYREDKWINNVKVVVQNFFNN